MEWTKTNPRYIWFNEEIIPFEEAKIHVLTPTAFFGVSVFEGIRAYWNSEQKELFSFRAHDHYKRLHYSAKLMRIRMPYGVDQLVDQLIEIIKANEFKEDVHIRHMIYISEAGSFYATEPVGSFIAVMPWGRAFDLENGISCKVSSWQRIDDNSVAPRIKSGSNYQNNRFAQLEAQNDGYTSSIILNKNGKVTEGPGSCLFLVKDGRLITPQLSEGILDSITRSAVIILARDMGLDVEERTVDRTELYLADEAFFAGSAAEVAPIVKIDDLMVGDGKPGKITGEISKKYFNVVRGPSPEYSAWLTPTYKR